MQSFNSGEFWNVLRILLDYHIGQFYIYPLGDLGMTLLLCPPRPRGVGAVGVLFTDCALKVVSRISGNA